MTGRVELGTAAWFGDRRTRLSVPRDWEVTIVSAPPAPPLSDPALAERLRRPVGTPPLSELASRATRAALVVDDLTRPTPAFRILPAVLEELARGGLGPDAIRVFVAGGAHPPASPEDVRKKIGASLAGRLRVVAHGSGSAVRRFGRSPGGVDIWVNAELLDCDLRVGISGAYPHHHAAGFSGGAKILAPGMCGVETARQLHNRFGGPQAGSERAVSPFRLEAERIAGSLGLDYLVNVVLDERRRVVDLAAGDVVQAHRMAVDSAIRHYGVTMPADADVVLANAYPLDTSLLFMARGMWPLERARTGATGVLFGAAPAGLGRHALGDPGQGMIEKAGEWLRRFRPSDAPAQIRSATAAVRRRFAKRRTRFCLVCPGVTAKEARLAYRRVSHYSAWKDLVPDLVEQHGTAGVRLAVYPMAPLLIPNGDGG